MKNHPKTAEHRRLEAQHKNSENWHLWGPYLAERAWGTVREDYSAEGNAWGYFTHDQSRSRAYRWNEDGLAGISDSEQRLCLALAFWNGCDPILKERAFGLTGTEGNHGEDVKEAYFYLDATPTHSYLHYRYKYPQRPFPYAQLVQENSRRSREEPPFQLHDTGVLSDNRYFDIDVIYAKSSPETLLCRIRVANRGPEAANLHLLPTLWYRNTWAWDADGQRPQLIVGDQAESVAWTIEGYCSGLGSYRLYGRSDAKLLFTENDSNLEKLWGQPNRSPYVKDAFHRAVVEGEPDAVNPAQQGSKSAAWHQLLMASGAEEVIDLVLTNENATLTPADFDTIMQQRHQEANAFYLSLLPAETSPEDRQIFRQAMAGMIWNKQYYHFDQARWQDGDKIAPPKERIGIRNQYWRHLKAHDIIAMPDCWEYPWFASWDLESQAIALSVIDIDFAKKQLELLLNERYLHPNGHLPACEWNFADVNPPLHAASALSVFRREREQTGKTDFNFLQRTLNKLLLNYAWWLNRKDRDQHDLFEGGFLGLDNISAYDRSRPLPQGYRLEQADATGWMAMFALNMTMMALELAAAGHDYEDIAIQTYAQFLAIGKAIAGFGGHGLSMWDEDDQFFKDLILTPDGERLRLDVFSWVGIIPLFACEVVDAQMLRQVPRFREMLYEYRGGMFDGHTICACPQHINEKGEHLLSLVDHTRLPGILKRVFDEEEFLSAYGIRSLSRIHAERRDLGLLPGIGKALIEYVPGESNSWLFGGNSNWRGPVWFPTNYWLIESLEKFHRYLGDNFKVSVPGLAVQALTLEEINFHLAERLINLFRRDADGLIPAYPADSPLQHDLHWQDQLLFHEYFHAETGQGLGASHQTGWTALVALLLQRNINNPVLKNPAAPGNPEGRMETGGCNAPQD
ncbi:MAG: MGH1-like glycoside hydrolase domain-containing protein [Methylomonas sp.]